MFYLSTKTNTEQDTHYYDLNGENADTIKGYRTVKFYFFKKITSPLFRCPGAVFFEGEKSRKVDSRFLHAVSLHRRSDGCGPSVVAPHDFIVRIKTINPLFFF